MSVTNDIHVRRFNKSIRRFGLSWLLSGIFLAIASFLRQFTTAENDYAIRELAGELTPSELEAERREDKANYEKNMREALAWSDIWPSE